MAPIHETAKSPMSVRQANPIVVVLVTIVLAFFFCVPIAFIAYGVLGGLLGGLAILGVFIFIQFALFRMARLLRRK
jgi:hypothetical protein